MTIAWFRLFTVLPLRPVLRIPSLRSCIAFSTFFFAPLEYFLATIVHLRFSIDSHPVNALCISRLHDRPLAWVENQQLRHPSVSGSGVVVALTVTSGTRFAAQKRTDPFLTDVFSASSGLALVGADG